jgi:hypothetical protein
MTKAAVVKKIEAYVGWAVAQWQSTRIARGMGVRFPPAHKSGVLQGRGRRTTVWNIVKSLKAPALGASYSG